MSSACCRLTAKGFSQYTALPAAMAAIAMGKCKWLGVVMATRSTLGSLINCCQSLWARSNPQAEAHCCARSASASATAARRRCTGSSNAALTLRNASAWARPIKPVPIRPIPSERMATSFGCFIVRKYLYGIKFPKMQSVELNYRIVQDKNPPSTFNETPVV